MRAHAHRSRTRELLLCEQVILEWSQEAVRATLLAQLQGRPTLAPQPAQQAPAGSWTFR